VNSSRWKIGQLLQPRLYQYNVLPALSHQDTQFAKKKKKKLASIYCVVLGSREESHEKAQEWIIL
jgi:hypothetical protein